MTLKLVLKGLQHNKARFLIAIFGVAAATGLVVFSLGLAMTAAAQSRVTVERMSEPFNCWISSSGVGLIWQRGAPPPPGMVWSGRSKSLPQPVVEGVKALPQVERMLPCSITSATLDYRPDGRVMQGPPLTAAMMVAPSEGSPYSGVKVRGEWPDPQSAELEVAICTSLFTPRRLAPPPLGSTLVLVTPQATVNAKITAIIEMPRVLRGFPTVFGTVGVMQQANAGKYDAAPTALLLTSTDASVATALKELAREHGADSPDDQRPFLTALARSDLEPQFVSDSLMSFKRQAPLLLMLAVTSALCMLINALMVGVEHKQRILALLRAAGMTIHQMLRLVMFEGVIIALGGWVVGLLGGWLVLLRFVKNGAETFPEGVHIGWQTPLYSALGVALIAAVSFFWPCRRALKIRPLDALAEHAPEMLDRQRGGASRRLRPWLGFLLLFPMLILAYPLHITAMLRSVLILCVGIPLHIFGLLLFMPEFIRIFERFLGPWMAAVLRLDRTLLQRRLSRHVWRTVGMALTLAVGLGSFSAIHIWGASLTKPFVPSKEFPDVIVSMLPNGYKGDAASLVAPLPGVADGNCLAIVATQFFVTDKVVEQIKKSSGRAPFSPNVLLWGADPQKTFGGEKPLAHFKFVVGSREEAAAALQGDDACVITLMLARETGIKVGESLEINREVRQHGVRGRGVQKPPEACASGESTVALKVVGIVDLNWHLVTSRANMRGRNGMSGMTMGPVFVNEKLVRRLDGNRDTTYFLWLNLSEAYSAKGPLAGGQALEADLRKVLEIDQANTVRVHHRMEIEDGTISHGTRLVGDMARAPFWSLIVLSSGIISLLVASFQASARELGVMRAVGMTRGQLGRMLLGEALLTGICGICLSLLSGFAIGWTFTGWTRAWMAFGGLPVSLDVPWLVILLGIGFAFGLCLIMAAIPIVWLIRHEQTQIS